MRDYKDICSAGYAVVLFCEYIFQKLNMQIGYFIVLKHTGITEKHL